MVILMIAFIHAYFYQNNLISLINDKVYDLLSIYFKKDIIKIDKEYGVVFNLILSSLLSLLTLFLISIRHYIYLFLLSIFIPGLSLMWLLYSSNHQEYYHIVYLWIPYANSFMLLAILDVLINAREQRKYKVSLEASDEAALQNMIHVVNIHDKETGEHIIRTKEYARTLAQYLYDQRIYVDTIDREFIKNIYKTAPLHDIGKVGIPDNILKKPGKFSKEEYKIMQSHPALGREIVMNSIQFYSKNSLLNMAHDIVFYHHERWDGSGYPSKLKGESIPISAQIMALADVYDALISKRRYKESFSYQKADSIIVAEKNRAFNPILVDAFLEVKEHFHQISKQWEG